jgi:hypothetical protein
MLIERRAYTMRAGQRDRFVQMQIERGFEAVRNTQERLIGYFSVLAGPDDQIVHLYRYDSLDDWQQRLHGYYAVPTSNTYLSAVRKLMTEQENRFLSPAPLAALTPNWGNGADWLPGQPVVAQPRPHVGQIIEESVLILAPGLLDDYWDSIANDGLTCPEATSNLLATFYCLTGRLHQIVTYRRYDSLEEREAHRRALLSHPGWVRHLEFVQPRLSSQTANLLRPVQVPEMSPFFMSSEATA